MKLNYKRTICVGFAFFLISAFWQAYDAAIPLTLTNKFGMSQSLSGIVMALDNILALFLLPLFGAISDKVNSRMGRRTPFIVIGTVIAAIAFVGLSVVDNAQLKNIAEVSSIDDPAALRVIYEKEADSPLLTPEGEKFVLEDIFTEDEFAAITCQTANADGSTSTNSDYTNYVVPARQAYAWQVTAESPATLVFFIGLLLIVLVAMATFRSPAVALMPDVTMKPLRSKANAVINLMGSAGGILVLVLGMVFATSSVRNSLMSYSAFFGVVSGIMLAALAIFLLTVREPRFVREMQEQSREYGIEDAPAEVETGEKRRLSSAEKRSLFVILASIVLWFFGYNAITSKYSVYAVNVLHKDYNMTLILAQAAAIISYLPVGFVASKVGRKKTIMAGVIMLGTAFGIGAFMREDSPTMLMNCIFVLAGMAWATINVNSFPMVVELATGADVGKYTGFYYTASMAAQVITPMVSGFMMDKMGMTVLFPYATAFVALAFVTMCFVRHGDSRPTAKNGIEALEDMD